MLVYFSASTIFSGVSYGLLSQRAEACLSVGTALLLPATILAFRRPVPLPYSWAAPPERLQPWQSTLALVLTLALAAFHASSLYERHQLSGRVRPARGADGRADVS